MNNFKNLKSMLTEGYTEALPMWLKAIAKAFPEMKIEKASDSDFVVLWKNSPVAAASVEDDKIDMAPISNDSELKKRLKALKIKKFQKLEDVRKYIMTIIH